MIKKTYYFTLLSLYLNYIFQGMAIIILSQNIDSLVEQLNTTKLGVSATISFIGVGRIIAVLFAGRISDKLGRKYTIIIGMLFYMIFYAGIPLCPSVQYAMFVTIFAGFGNAFLDTGTYPALQETIPENASSNSVLNKAFISIGQFSLPIIVSFLLMNDLPYYYAFILCFVLLLSNLFFLNSRKFKKANIQYSDDEVVSKVNANFKIEGISLILFSFTSAATFNIIALWLPQYAIEYTSMIKSNALLLVSVYSFGSFVSVFLTAALVKKFPYPTLFMLLGPIISTIIIIILLIYPSPTTCIIMALGVGIFAAGGIWQLGMSKLLEWFSHRRGQVASYYSLLASLSILVIPTITGILADINIGYVMYFNLLMALLTTIFVIIVFYRNRKLENQVR